MQMQDAIKNVFTQLSQSITLLGSKQYAQPCKSLFNASIGQHVRHIIELFQCLQQGYDAGIVNYDERKRNPLIEQDKGYATSLLSALFNDMDKPGKPLLLKAVYNPDSEMPEEIPTNYFRELAYNLEHTIHHMALIRIGINEIAEIELPANYGIACSTIKYQQACAQ